MIMNVKKITKGIPPVFFAKGTEGMKGVNL
jgi:hypothetical protein